ncbi:MAG: bifunctional nuclease family protein, partial [Bacteroidetes bacterium]|nr:bifunctional nuclease family protein [Bacteroidota bacterium]
MMDIPVEIKWIIEDEQSNGYILQLAESNVEKSRVLPVVIGAPEAHAIALELQGIKPFRPFTHDLAVQILEALDAEVRKVVITELNKNTFFASIHLSSNSVGDQTIDSRPSDAIAIAIRVGAPIFVSEDVMSAAALEIEAQAGLKNDKSVTAENST